MLKAPPGTGLRRDPTAASRRQHHTAGSSSRKRRPAARIYHHNLNAADEGASKPCGETRRHRNEARQPPRQTANLSHVNHRSAPRRCNDAVQQSSTPIPPQPPKPSPAAAFTTHHPKLPTTTLEPGVRHCEEWRSFLPFFSSSFSRGAEEWRLVFTQRRVK
jgi:hypothetical protein